MLKTRGMIVKNYRGQPVVTSMGLTFIFPCALSIIPFMVAGIEPEHMAFLTVVTSLTLTGFIDDVLGEATIKGIKGHVAELIKGRISTGGVKLIITALVGMFVSRYYHKSLIAWGVYALLFSLFVNFINLMDLRPGRAIKVFLLSVILLMILGGFSNVWILTPVLTALPFHMKGEMEEKYMLGDTGANLLGGIAGFYAIKAVTLAPAAVMAAVLLSIHVIAEYRSLSRFIESIPALRFIDQLWRLKTDGDTSMDRA
jgi:UDP-N-acetylmuramyl pentapeptide phosphotransferase/UDP-N-acetylglucosamine-1-phosphate transferase